MRVAAFLFLATTSACAAVVGFEDLTFDADAGAGDAGDDGRPPVDGAPQDGGSGDATPDGASCFDGLEHDYCYDFENVANVDDGWTGKEVVGTGVLELATPPAGANHGKRALHSVIGRSDAGTSVHIARVSRQALNPPKPDGTTRRITSRFDLYVESGDIAGYQAHIYTLLLGSSTGQSEDTFFLRLSRDADSATTLAVEALEIYLTDAGIQYAGKTTSLTMRTQEWTHVEVVLNERIPGSNGGVVMTIGDASDSYALSSGSRTQKLRADFGWGIGTLGGGDWNGFVDNVTIDYTK